MRVGIIGASGYTGVELVRLLARHPEVEVTVLTSERHAGEQISDLFPSLKGVVDLRLSEAAIEHLLGEAEFFFTALPHGASMGVVEGLLAGGGRVVDLSADFRLRDPVAYERWYGKHNAPHLLPEAVYGLAELYREKIKGARLVANPGCYPTSVILPLAPLLREGLISPKGIVVDAKSGVSGAGRGASLKNLFCEVAEGMRAYSVAVHRHTPEIEQELGRFADAPAEVLFVPHLAPMSRGILATIYARARAGLSSQRAYEALSVHYEGEHFVRLLPSGIFPSTMQVRGSNYCDIGVMVDQRSGVLVAISAIDNLVKGGAGQAVQNMNIMCGWPEGMGLEHLPLAP